MEIEKMQKEINEIETDIKSLKRVLIFLDYLLVKKRNKQVSIGKEIKKITE